MSDKNIKDWNMSDQSGTLSERIAKFEAKTTAKKQKHKSRQLPAAGMALAGRVATELVAGIAVGAFAGWLIDRWLGTTPAFMLVLFFWAVFVFLCFGELDKIILSVILFGQA